MGITGPHTHALLDTPTLPTESPGNQARVVGGIQGCYPPFSLCSTTTGGSGEGEGEGAIAATATAITPLH